MIVNLAYLDSPWFDLLIWVVFTPVAWLLFDVVRDLVEGPRP